METCVTVHLYSVIFDAESNGHTLKVVKKRQICIFWSLGKNAQFLSKYKLLSLIPSLHIKMRHTTINCIFQNCVIRSICFFSLLLGSNLIRFAFFCYILSAMSWHYLINWPFSFCLFDQMANGCEFWSHLSLRSQNKATSYQTIFKALIGPGHGKPQKRKKIWTMILTMSGKKPIWPWKVLIRGHDALGPQPGTFWILTKSISMETTFWLYNSFQIRSKFRP